MSGFVLCSPEIPCPVSRVIDAELIILEAKAIITSGYACVLHIHEAVEEVQIKNVICLIDKKTGAKKRAKFVKQNDKCIMRIECNEPFCVDLYDTVPQMGRFVLRDEGKTIAIGKVKKLVE